MTELTAEERNRIYEEEKVRREAQRQLQAEEADQKSRDRSMGCITVIGLLIGFFILVSVLGSSDSKPDPYANRDREAIAYVQGHINPGGETVLAKMQATVALAMVAGTFVQVEGWSAYQESGSMYHVSFSFKAADVENKAEWEVDVANGQVEPKNQLGYTFMN
ncbi:MAG: hypothetical protein ACM3XZ_10110 [Betaproteobacteria bacterium]